MPTVALFNQDGTQNGDVQLNEAVFGIEPNESVVFDAVIMQRASLRQGTHAVKNRSAVRGGGRKPWRQKGTGRARQGSIRSPQWVGGGTVFGPTPRSYAYKLPRKVRRLAIRSVLSQKVLDNSLVVVETLNFDAPKTKAFAEREKLNQYIDYAQEAITTAVTSVSQTYVDSLKKNGKFDKTA